MTTALVGDSKLVLAVIAIHRIILHHSWHQWPTCVHRIQKGNQPGRILFLDIADWMPYLYWSYIGAEYGLCGYVDQGDGGAECDYLASNFLSLWQSCSVAVVCLGSGVVIAGVGGLDVKNVQLDRKIEAGMKEMNPKIEAGNAHGKYETARLKQETPRTLGRFDDGAEGSIAAKKSKNWLKWGYLQVGVLHGQNTKVKWNATNVSQGRSSMSPRPFQLLQ